MNADTIIASREDLALSRWVLAALLVAVAHSFLGIWLLRQGESAGMPADAIIAELAPLTVETPAEEEKAEPVQEMAEAPTERVPPEAPPAPELVQPAPSESVPSESVLNEPMPPSEFAPTPIEPKPIDPQPNELAPEPVPKQTFIAPEPEIKPPPTLPEKPHPRKPVVLLEPPPLKQPPLRVWAAQEKKVVKSVAKLEKEVSARREQKTAVKEQQRQNHPATHPARMAALPTTTFAAPSANVAARSSGFSPAGWENAVHAQILRNKQYPEAARSRGEHGTASLFFTLDRTGRVIAARIVGSSGSAALDQEAVAMVRRASPLPAPPPEVATPKNFTIPISFNLR